MECMMFRTIIFNTRNKKIKQISCGNSSPIFRGDNNFYNQQRIKSSSISIHPGECGAEKCDLETSGLQTCDFQTCGLETCGLEICGLETCGLQTCGLQTCDFQTCNLKTCGLETFDLETYDLETYDLETICAEKRLTTNNNLQKWGLQAFNLQTVWYEIQITKNIDFQRNSPTKQPLLSYILNLFHFSPVLDEHEQLEGRSQKCRTYSRTKLELLVNNIESLKYGLELLMANKEILLDGIEHLMGKKELLIKKIEIFMDNIELFMDNIELIMYNIEFLFDSTEFLVDNTSTKTTVQQNQILKSLIKINVETPLLSILSMVTDLFIDLTNSLLIEKDTDFSRDGNNHLLIKIARNDTDQSREVKYTLLIKNDTDLSTFKKTLLSNIDTNVTSTYLSIPLHLERVNTLSSDFYNLLLTERDTKLSIHMNNSLPIERGTNLSTDKNTTLLSNRNNITSTNLNIPLPIARETNLSTNVSNSLLSKRDTHISSMVKTTHSLNVNTTTSSTNQTSKSPPHRRHTLPQESLYKINTPKSPHNPPHCTFHSRFCNNDLHYLLSSQNRSGHHASSSWICILFFIIIHIQQMGLSTANAQGLIGTVTTCSNEGEEVKIPSITDNPCISCVCKNNLVECESKRCKNVEGCHAILFDQPSKMCCEVCKGCVYQGTQYESGHIWRDKKDICKQYTCRAGVVSVSKVQCFSHCFNPVQVIGQCCPVCEGCLFRGHNYKENDTFRLTTDLCTSCTCKKGNLLCERELCPVLNCPVEVIYQPKNECCPKCRGQRPVFDVPSQCYFAKSVYKRNQQFFPNKCTKCVCKVVDKTSGTSVCETETCPTLDCPETERHMAEGDDCCTRCWEKRVCIFDNKTYKHKEEWKPNVCIKCLCDDGVTYCQRERCSNSLWCPQGYRLLLTENECCPKCVEYDAVCSVFGDPHYKTFDGLMYSFQGTCKYILTQDCTGNDFLIKVRNGVRFSSGYAWTQMLVVFVLNHRISLLQNSVVKVDKRRTRLPFTKPGMFTVTKEGDLVKLKTMIGLDVTWDGDSFLEVTVTTKYKHKLCGLCGNYNGIKSDDFIGKSGTIYTNGDEYGHSWRIGSKKGCKVRPHFTEATPLCERDVRAKQRSHRVCSIFYSRAFRKCRQKVPADVYVNSCITDMCDCPEGRYCACEAIRAYTSQCTRSGFEVLWEKIKNCHAPHVCPESAVNVECAVTCPKTCDNMHLNLPCPEACLRGCQCQDGKVLYQEECVPVAFCPKKS